MARWKKVLLAVAIIVAGIVLLPWLALSSMDAVRDLHRTDAKILERDIRQELPLGSSLPQVEEALTKRGIEHSFDPGCSNESSHFKGEITFCRTEFATVRNVKGSSWLIQNSIGFEFHFNQKLQLTSIDADMIFTGP
jgi:hypothetical protein